jgi:hypothetical protein
MTLTPTISLTLGQQQYTSHATGLVVSLGLLPAVNSFRVNLPAATPIDAVPGDPATLSLDGGEGDETVLTGKLRMMRRSIAATEVMGADGGADLAAVRPAATYRQQAGRDVIQALASDAGVDTADIDLDLPMAAYVADQSSTAGEHIADLSRLAGAKASMNSDGALVVGGPPSGPPDLALLYGREIIEYRMRENAPPRATRVAIGNGPAGSADAPDALQPSKTVVPSDAPEPGMDTVWRPRPILRTASAANAASGAYADAAAATTKTLHCRCFLLPRLRPGMVIEVQSLPDRLAGGPWQVTRVSHRVVADAPGSTTFDANDTAGGGGLLAAGLSALAAL